MTTVFVFFRGKMTPDLTGKFLDQPTPNIRIMSVDANKHTCEFSVFGTFCEDFAAF